MLFYSPKLYLRDPWISIPLAGSILIQIFLWVILVMNVSPDTPVIFLHYNIIFGVDSVGEWWQIYFPPLIGVLVILFNCLCSLAVYFYDKFLARLLNAWILFFHLFLAIGIALLVRLNS
ncbi:MAG: hypothetical protein HYT15_02570 [Candidatus Magasanikbacteria bacterium]|nr:hypothetical protein [Candidatus Magasanikbacteria bacterium]